MSLNYGEFEFTAEELDALFADDKETTPAPNTDTASDTSTTDVKTSDNAETSVEQTKAFAKRLSERTNKAVADERERIAKDMGFDSYEAMMKSKEAKIIEDSGLDPESSNKAVDKIVQMRLDADPRMQELEEYRAQRMKDFAKHELEDIKDITNGEITSFSQLPKPVIELWKKCGSLKSAYLQLEGENLLKRTRANQSKGSTDHLRSPGDNGSTADNDKRTLTADEKRVWKFFNPQMTDEELNKITVKK